VSEENAESVCGVGFRGLSSDEGHPGIASRKTVNVGEFWRKSLRGWTCPGKEIQKRWGGWSKRRRNILGPIGQKEDCL